jgi:hypothetical protein
VINVQNKKIMDTPFLDPAPITRHLRAKAGSHLLVAAVHHSGVFEILDRGPMPLQQLQEKLKLRSRPAMVLFPSLCAMELIKFNAEGNLEITELGRLLVMSNPSNIAGYTGLEKNDPGVLHMAQWLKNDGPADNSQGLSYVKDEHADSPMDEPEAARFFTMALAGRARYLSPVVAQKMSKRKGHLLDIAGGTGYYTYEWLLANPDSTATIIDTAEVLKVSAEILDDFHSKERIRQRVTFLASNMLADKLPKADIVLAASLFHDWPEDTCELLAKKFAAAINPGGELWVHDAFLDDTLDGPLAVTDYSAMLFLGTKGRAYSRSEYRGWLIAAGLVPTDNSVPTLMDYSLISAVKPV